MKILRNKLRALIVWGVLFASGDRVSSQTWTQTSAPSANWTGIAASADGTKLVALANGFLTEGIYTSTNSGTTWMKNNAPLVSWRSVASSADGTKLVAVSAVTQIGPGPSLDGNIYVSTNSGSTWQQTGAPSNLWVSVVSSADGSELAAIATYYTSNSPNPVYGLLFISTNSGASWTSNTAPQKTWRSVALSADGSTMVAVCTTGIFISTNWGATWTSNNVVSGHETWKNMVVSADGTKLMALGYSSLFSVTDIFTSTDSGATWISNNVPGYSTYSFSTASSADGTRLVAASSAGLYISTNSGASWVANNLTNNLATTESVYVASSADGNRLFAVISSTSGFPQKTAGAIYTMYSTPSPQLNLTPSSTNLTLAWTVPSTNFVLQQSADLISWTDVTNPPALNFTNLQNEVLLSPTNGSGFYWLKTP